MKEPGHGAKEEDPGKDDTQGPDVAWVLVFWDLF